MTHIKQYTSDECLLLNSRCIVGKAKLWPLCLSCMEPAGFRFAVYKWFRHLCSIPSQYPLLIDCHPFSPTNHLVIENHRSLIQICITPSLESTPWFILSASPVMSRLTSSFTCQLISIIIPTLVINHSFTLSLFHSRLKTYLLNKSFIPSHLRLRLPTGLPSWQRDWTYHDAHRFSFSFTF